MCWNSSSGQLAGEGRLLLFDPNKEVGVLPTPVKMLEVKELSGKGARALL